ncbi:Ribonuclease H-like domain protein [Raphanus sativus]|nr:Ribonuclease H-like domain protein [Raphanus sativus]
MDHSKFQNLPGSPFLFIGNSSESGIRCSRMARGTKSNATYLSLTILGENVPNHAIICRSDAAWKAGPMASGGAWSFYNNQGGLISSQSKTFSSVISPLVAEGLALRHAMEHASSLGLTAIIFESDSMQLVTAIAGEFKLFLAFMAFYLIFLFCLVCLLLVCLDSALVTLYF